ncbi:hypothetical protein K435DRAFT_731562 [Dendrothele bispora CBS 962.96]|uniref:Uncharacterized protein n=1 Tax=Dendrothele bispora (strain CBS 962.96) TaxID=1314807 RepID=A0A4S8LBR8_DENBC|nr:hypothetical protein K435DRAFT_731562 [Dendrothele bispora CBS 962.96]
MEEIRPEVPGNAMMEALQASTSHTYTQNGAPAFNSTNSPTLDAFNRLNTWVSYGDLESILPKSWAEDPSLTLRLIWQLRSIHDGKGEKEAFYRAFGWLYEHHPRTAVANLHMLVSPVCSTKKRPELRRSHGYWKDLLNILALAATGTLGVSEPEFLHRFRPERQWNKPKSERFSGPGGLERHNQEQKTRAREQRTHVGAERHQNLINELSNPKFRALFITVARLFTDQLIEDIKIVVEIENIPRDSNADVTRLDLLHKISLAGKWAPTPGAAHDKFTNISSAISLLLHHSRASIPQVFPRSLENFDPFDPQYDDSHFHTLRSYYQRWFLTRIRSVTHVIEPLMTSNKWSSIRYARVSSLCMEKNTNHFLRHDQERFSQYLVDVESGKKSISGATLFPHDIIGRVIEIVSESKSNDAKKAIADANLKVIEGQWNSLVERLKESGALDNSIAVCDVSGSMGHFLHPYQQVKSRRGYQFKRPYPILPAIALSLLLSRLAKPPFSNGFITFSAIPEFVQLDPTLSLYETITKMNSANWDMNTDFASVFLNLILPRAKEYNVPNDQMIKRIFVFSDMQFDNASGAGSDAGRWNTTHEVVVKAYEEAGYDVPQIVYWDLANAGTVEVKADREGVAMMNGFSGAMMKVFMGEEEEVEEEENWEEVNMVDGEPRTVAEKRRKEFTPISVMKRAVMKPCFDGLVVVD